MDPSPSTLPSPNVSSCLGVPSILFHKAEEAKSDKLLVLVISKVVVALMSLCEFRIRHLPVVEGRAALADNSSTSASPSSESSTKHIMSDESPFIRPSSPTQQRSEFSVPAFQGDMSASVLHILS